MPSFSGLWDGVHGDGYAAMPKADAKPPQARGIVRTFMQRPSMHGHVNALGRNSPATRAAIDADRPDITVPGTFSWPARTLARDVTVTNSASHIDGADVNESHARVPDATAADLVNTYDTTLRNGHPADKADSGVTSPAVSEVVSS
jgi:hypothetical protein